MRFYTKQRRYYCGIDLHARFMYLCILDQEGNVVLHKNFRTCPEAFLAAIGPFRDELVVGVECVFCWYWIADLCEREVTSYARLVRCAHESAGKRSGRSRKKIGNMHLKWAFSEAAVLFLRANPKGLEFKKKLERKHGKAKALSILAHKLGRAVYYMLRRKQAFHMERFLAA